MEYSFHSKTWSAKEIKDMKIIIILVKDNYTRGKIIIMGNALQEEKNPLKNRSHGGEPPTFITMHSIHHSTKNLHFTLAELDS